MMDSLSIYSTEIIQQWIILKAGNIVRVVLQQLDKMNPYFISSMAVGYQLEVQMLVQLVPALFVNVPLMITLHVVDVLIAECLSWFVIVARYDLIYFLCNHFCLCASKIHTILKESGGGKCKRKWKRIVKYITNIYTESRHLVVWNIRLFQRTKLRIILGCYIIYATLWRSHEILDKSLLLILFVANRPNSNVAFELVCL